MQFRKGAAEDDAPEFAPSQASDVSPDGPARRRAAVQPVAAGPTESVIDASARFEGQILANYDLRVQGHIGGEVVCRGTLTIEEQAVSNARIEAQECEIRGTVDGDITCLGVLRLASTAVVTATMRAGSLIVDEGASVTGSVETNYTGEIGAPADAPRKSRRK